MELITPPFEGPEKKLEIILFSPQPGLRSNRDGRWNRVVDASRASIISQIQTDELTGYLLSESSLFVWDDRILMITCGRTTLVRALPEIVRIVGKENIAFVFYEQKNFMFPQQQPSRFESDVEMVTEFFPGKYYKLGPANYDHVNVFYSSHAREAPEGDATLQLLMHELDAEAMDIFCAANVENPQRAEEMSGLDRLYPRPILMDGFLFTPCGYSLNGLVGNKYLTIHVTPQADSSYVSFETNILEEDYSGTIQKVISIFRPRRFSLVLTTCNDDKCLALHETVIGGIPRYSPTDKSFYEFDCGYSVSFLNYVET